VILPATSIPYKVGAGFSYEIGKHAIIKSQTNYQYNIIQKKWEWFFSIIILKSVRARKVRKSIKIN
jgi:hypothetical protein